MSHHTCAITTPTTRIAARITTVVGPTLTPGVSSSKKRISPAPPEGMGPSPRFFLLFLAVFGILIEPLEDVSEANPF